MEIMRAEDVCTGGGAKGILPGPSRNGVEKDDPMEYESTRNDDDEAVRPLVTPPARRLARDA